MTSKNEIHVKTTCCKCNQTFNYSTKEYNLNEEGPPSFCNVCEVEMMDQWYEEEYRSQQLHKEEMYWQQYAEENYVFEFGN